MPSARGSRARGVRPSGTVRLAVLAVALGGVLAGCQGDPAPSATPQDPADVAAELETLTNDARADEGLPAYEHSDCAATAAVERATALVGQAELTHADMNPVMTACDVMVAGENLSRTAEPPADVIDAWLHSSGHRANLLDAQYTAMGAGCVPDGDEVLCSLVFVAQ